MFAAFLVGALLLAAGVVGENPDTGGTGAPGVPVVRPVDLSGRSVPVVVVPNRPGFNLVGIGEAQAAAGLDRNHLAPGILRPGSTRRWVEVDLPAGASTLWISAGARTGSVRVDTGRSTSGPAATLRGADGPECAAGAVGTVLAARDKPLTSCPADRLTAADAAALRVTVTFLAQRRERVITLVADDSPRGRAAAHEVRVAAARQRIEVTTSGRSRHPVVIVSGWTGAAAVLRAVAGGDVAAQGTYLAPWLLSEDLLAPSAGQVLALRYAPRDPVPAKYLAALSQRLPGESPSAAGYEAWAEALGNGLQSPVRLYAASEVHVPGMPPHQHAGTDWLPGGMIIPVSGPLRQ
jgi:hypothetical protein